MVVIVVLYSLVLNYIITLNHVKIHDAFDVSKSEQWLQFTCHIHIF